MTVLLIHILRTLFRRKEPVVDDSGHLTETVRLRIQDILREAWETSGPAPDVTDWVGGLALTYDILKRLQDAQLSDVIQGIQIPRKVVLLRAYTGIEYTFDGLNLYPTMHKIPL